MLSFFDINNIFFEMLGYKMSHLEWWATVSGGVAVWLSARENVWSWVLGLVNVVLAAILFWQGQLYPDVSLQVFFFITNIIGWWQWKFPSQNEVNHKQELSISRLSQNHWLGVIVLGLLATTLMGTFASNLNTLFPNQFNKPSAFPYLDSFTTIMSILATFLLIRKKVEAWFVWLLVDIISTYIYFIKGFKLYALLYLIFCFIAVFGTINWTKRYKNQEIRN